MNLRISVILLLIIFLLGACSEAQKKSEIPENTEIPRIAFKLITESQVDPCPICARKKMDEAISILVRKYDIDKIIKTNSSCGFMRIQECGKNEFVLSCYKQREPYVVPGDGSEKLFPLLVFRFHTRKEHLVGITESDYTAENYSDTINGAALNEPFQGEVVIVNFKYGDGPSFNFFKEKNQLVVHCRVFSLRNSAMD